jgi:hypothetical protein
MRLPKELVQQIAETMTASLETKGLVTFGKPRKEVAAKIAEVIIADLVAEDRLNKDVEKMLSAYESEIAKGNMDYRKLFELTKQKLAKERGMVL